MLSSQSDHCDFVSAKPQSSMHSCYSHVFTMNLPRKRRLWYRYSCDTVRGSLGDPMFCLIFSLQGCELLWWQVLRNCRFFRFLVISNCSNLNSQIHWLIRKSLHLVPIAQRLLPHLLQLCYSAGRRLHQQSRQEGLEQLESMGFLCSKIEISNTSMHSWSLQRGMNMPHPEIKM